MACVYQFIQVCIGFKVGWTLKLCVTQYTQENINCMQRCEREQCFKGGLGPPLDTHRHTHTAPIVTYTNSVFYKLTWYPCEGDGETGHVGTACERCLTINCLNFLRQSAKNINSFNIKMERRIFILS